MSYDIYLTDPITGETIQLDEPHCFKGGTYAVGGTNEAWINITYNYGRYYHKYIDKEKGIRWLYGKVATICIPVLERAIRELGTKQSKDYWKSTRGNAGAALIALLEFAKARPDGIFWGD